jgi:tetratricopeptide (TPR) repeat protein
MISRHLVIAVFFAATAAFAQTGPQSPGTQAPANGPQNTPPILTNPQRDVPDKKAPAPKGPAVPSAPKGQASTPATPATAKQPDRSQAYYHYSLAHIYEELVSLYQRSEFANKAIEEYKLAIENDPGSAYLSAGLAELYAKTGRIRDAVTEAQEIIRRDPNNLDARKLLGRIYLRTLGDMQSGSQSQDMLRLAIEQYEQITRLEPNNIENHLLLGRLYRTNNEMAKAESEFKVAARTEPDSDEAVTSLAYLYVDEGDTKRAIQVLNALPESSRSAKAYSALGYSYEQQKDYKNAVEAYRKAVDLDHDNLDAARGLAQNLLNNGQTDAALEQYRTIADADPQDAQAYLRMAEIYRRNGKFDLALDSLKKAEGVVPDSLEVPFTRAQIYEAQGRYDEAAGIVQDLVQKTAKPAGNYSASESNNRAVFFERLGTIYKEANKLPQAIETFRKILDLGPENAARGYDQIIEAYRDNKQWQQATAVAEEAVQKLPENRGLKLVYAGQLADVGKADEAMAQAKALLKGTPADREVWVAMAQINSRLRHWKDAEDDLAQAGKLTDKPEDKQYSDFILASIYERQKRYEDAEQLFKKVLSSDPRNPQVLNYLGYMLADRGVRLEEALNYIKKAIDLDPQNGAYLDSLGWAYFKMGNYDMAEENLRKASEHMNNDATIQDHLGDLYQKTGRLKLAAAHWERALEEWNKSVPADIDQNDLAKTQKKLESAKVKLAQQQNTNK